VIGFDAVKHLVCAGSSAGRRGSTGNLPYLPELPCDDIGQGLSRPSHRRLVMTDTPQFCRHHLKRSSCRTFLREYDKLPSNALRGRRPPRYLLALPSSNLIEAGNGG